jgi:hypothetical protein
MRLSQAIKSSTIICCSVLSSASFVQAEGFTFPGSGCRSSYLAPGDDHALTPYGGTKIKNSGTTTNSALCPALNTDTTTTTAGNLRVNIDNQWSIQSCNLFGTTFDGQTTYAWPTPSLSQDGQSYKFTAAAQFFTNDSDTYVWACVVPVGDSIYSYTMGD